MKRYPVRGQAAKWCVCGEWFASERDEQEHVGKCPGPALRSCNPPCPVDLCVEWSKAGMCSRPAGRPRARDLGCAP